MATTLTSKDKQFLKKFYSPKGPLSKMAGYEFRQQQLDAALAVQDFLCNTEQKTFALEAPTGVGKTFAVLVPVLTQAVKEDAHILFLTASIVLQEQLIHKDLPRLKELLSVDFEFGLLKGRSNYICLRRAFGTGTGTGTSLFAEENKGRDKLSLWLNTTETGDLSELDIPPGSDIFSEVRAESQRCIGPRCPFRNRCFIQRAYRAAQSWDIIVANYHLFFSHALIDDGRGEFPIQYDWLICDEAHRLPEAVRSSATHQASLWDAMGLLAPRTLRAFANYFQSQSIDPDKMLKHAEKIRKSLEKLFDLAPTRLPENGEISGQNPELMRYGEMVKLEMDAMMRPLSVITEEKAEGATSSTEAAELGTWVSNVAKFRDDLLWCLSASRFPKWAYWAEADRSKNQLGAKLISRPVASAEIVQKVLEKAAPLKILFTSATLSTSATKKSRPDFSFWCRESGVVPDRAIIVDSPFDFAHQMEVVVGDVGLRVGAPGYDDKMCQIMERLCDDNGGRTLVLLSSLRLLRVFAAKMRERPRKYTVLVQRDMSQRQILQRFLEDETSILIGSASFREGVDIPGASLTQVIIDRIPFPHPNDPMVRAREQLEGGKAFKTVTLPLVRMALRQEVGRLIRSTSDHGRVVLLDGRAISYTSWDILAAFPKCSCNSSGDV